MALKKTIPKPGSNTPLSYWRPAFWTVGRERIEMSVEGFYSEDQRAAGAAPDVCLVAIAPIPDAFPAGTRSEQGYALLRTAYLDGVQAWADAEDYTADPWRQP